MSVEAISWVLRHSKSAGASRLALLSIAEHADRNGSNAWPSQDTIAREANLTVFWVRVAIRKLVAIGELKAIPPSGTGRGRGYIYALPLVSNQMALQLGEDVRGDTAPSENKGLLRIAEGATPQQEGATPYRGRGYSVAPNHPLNRPRNQTENLKPAAAAAATASRPISEVEHRRRIQARELRTEKEAEARREARAGTWDSHEPVIVRPEYLEKIRSSASAKGFP